MWLSYKVAWVPRNVDRIGPHANAGNLPHGPFRMLLGLFTVPPVMQIGRVSYAKSLQSFHSIFGGGRLIRSRTDLSNVKLVMIQVFPSFELFIPYRVSWSEGPVRLVVRTLASHAGNTGSNPVRDTTPHSKHE